MPKLVDVYEHEHSADPTERDLRGRTAVSEVCTRYNVVEEVVRDALDKDGQVTFTSGHGSMITLVD